MMDVKQLLIDTLQDFNFPIYQQGSMSDDEEYPESFFTFFNNYTEDRMFFDNVENATVWEIDLNIYSSIPEVVNGTLRQAKRLLKSTGFIVDGAGHDVLSDEKTHTGRGITLLYIER